MTERTLIDWRLAGRIARAVSGGDDERTLGQEEIEAVCAEGLERALGYSGLKPDSPVPTVELVGRERWIELNVEEMRDLAAPIEARAADELRLPWPVGGVVRGALGAAAGAEAGAVIGYSSRRVLGQYMASLGDAGKPPRMVLVGSNLENSARELDVPSEGFLLWVAIHEQTHSVQFASVPWLREHMTDMIGRLIEGTAGGIDFRALAAAARRLVSQDPRKALSGAMRGELTRALAGPEQSALLDEMQATMAVIEGYAEHVMDGAAADDPGLAEMRERMDQRRARRGGLADAIARLLGMGMKLRQYELGKAWSDAVVERAGIDGLNAVWASPAALPSLAELEAPDLWIDRVLGAAVPS